MNRRKLDDVTVVVSGAGGGLGRAIALRFARGGARLALLDRDSDGIAECAAEIRALRAEALAFTCDVTDPAACADAIRSTVGQFGGVDVLVNNAGITHRSAFVTTDPAVLRRVMDVNFFGALNLTHHALPHLLRNRGAIVAISSVAGFTPLVARTGYAASKHAMHGFFDSLRSEVRPQGVDITLVCPSFIATGIDRHALGPDGQPARHAQVVVGRQLTPESVADRIHAGVERRRRLLLIGGTAQQAWWISRLAPSLYERLMASRLRREMQQD